VRRWLDWQRCRWASFDEKSAESITAWKRNYILELGDLKLRSVLMALSTVFMYRLISIRTTSFLGRTRNLGISFALMGITFVPELFNPFLIYSS
jgi:hypothetical protein